jgi:hypothetical protein
MMGSDIFFRLPLSPLWASGSLLFIVLRIVVIVMYDEKKYQ